MVTTEVSMKTILAERLKRQRFTDPLKDPSEYKELFRLLQPVSPVFFSAPGDPPRLVHRTAFDDGAVSDEMRGERIIIKGRFLGGIIGYVLAEDLEVYANAFCRPLPWISEMQQTVLEAIKRSETLTTRQIKEETGLLVKQITPALHRLQEAFLVYEDQIDSDWERNWYEFASEWSEIRIEREMWEESAIQVLSSFFYSHVFATLEQIKDWSQLSSKPLVDILQNMEKIGLIIPKFVEGFGEGWILAQDISLKPSKIESSVFMIHKSDILSRSHTSELKRRFGNREVLQYLLIDGDFQGSVIGHWRIGPHDVDDIVVELPDSELIDRQQEIIKAVSWQYHPPHSRILRYAGKEVDM
jgi:hypothetical protein